MNINKYIRDKLLSSTAITSIVSSKIYPDISDYSNIPCLLYRYVSQTNTLNMKKLTVELKGITTTQDQCETLHGYIYSLFDNTTSRIYEKVQDLKIESIDIINSLPAVYDNNNKIWFNNTDIRINYIK